MPIETKSRLTIKLPDLDFTQTFKEIADKIIIPDIQLGINRSMGIDGKPFPALEPATVAGKTGARKKARKGGGLKSAGVSGARGGSQQLVDTGELKDRSMESVQIARNHIRILIGPGRNKIAYYLQITGVGKKRKKFNFFGISQRAEFQAISKMRATLAKALGKVNGK